MKILTGANYNTMTLISPPKTNDEAKKKKMSF
jgi:hypothetical protein